MKPNQQQEQLEKRKVQQWLKWLFEPETIRFLCKLGLTTVKILRVLKWLIEFFAELNC